MKGILTLTCACLIATNASAQMRTSSVDDATTILASIWAFNSVCETVSQRVPDDQINSAGISAARKMHLDIDDPHIRRIARGKGSAMLRGVVFYNDAERRSWCRDVKQIIDEAK